MPYEFGDVVLVRFPFSSQTAFKQRPAIVVSNRAYNAAKPDVVIMPSPVRYILLPAWVRSGSATGKGQTC